MISYLCRCYVARRRSSSRPDRKAVDDSLHADLLGFRHEYIKQLPGALEAPVGPRQLVCDVADILIGGPTAVQNAFGVVMDATQKAHVSSRATLHLCTALLAHRPLLPSPCLGSVARCASVHHTLQHARMPRKGLSPPQNTDAYVEDGCELLFTIMQLLDEVPRSHTLHWHATLQAILNVCARRVLRQLRPFLYRSTVLPDGSMTCPTSPLLLKWAKAHLFPGGAPSEAGSCTTPVAAKESTTLQPHGVQTTHQSDSAPRYLLVPPHGLALCLLDCTLRDSEGLAHYLSADAPYCCSAATPDSGVEHLDAVRRYLEEGAAAGWTEMERQMASTFVERGRLVLAAAPQ